MKLTKEQLEALLDFSARLTAALVLAGTENDFEESCDACGMGNLPNLIWQIADDIKDSQGLLQTNYRNNMSDQDKNRAELSKKPNYLSRMLESIIPGRVADDPSERLKQIERLEEYLDIGMDRPDVRNAICREYQGNNGATRPRTSAYLYNPPVTMTMDYDVALESARNFFKEPGRKHYIATGKTNLEKLFDSVELAEAKKFGILTEEDFNDDRMEVIVKSDIAPSARASIIGKMYKRMYG